jgi:hypothetical protein
MLRPIRSAEVVVQEYVLHRGQGLAQLVHHGHAVEVAPAVAHAIAGDQHLGCNLFEAVEHGIRSHVGRAQAPHAA